MKNEDIAHAWNVVWLDEDTCVYVDVTWDDQGDSIYHYYFGISKQEIAEDHTVAAEKFILPECSHDDLSYFDNSERVVDENTTAAELAELFGPSINNRRTAIIYYDGSIPFSTWISGISGSVYNKLDGGGFTYSYESANINKEIHLSFMGTFPPMTYSVNISAGANIATVAKLSQYVEISNEMTAVVFNAEDGYYFPSDYAFSKNGVSVIRNSSRQITVCGIPTANTQIVLPAATAMTKSAKPSATVVATGSDSAVLSGVSAGMKYSLGGSVWTDVTSSADILLTGIEPCDIYIVTKGNGEDKLDSDAQVISITQHSTPKVNVTDPTTADGKGSIATENIHEYSLDGENWITCTGALEGLDVGTYYVRVKASGSVLASETQLAIVHEYNFIKVSDISVVGSLTLYTGKSEMLVVSISPENADDKRVIFTSDNESVATVDENGKIIAISKGKAIITVTLVDGGLTAECAVEVLCEHDTSGEWQFDDDRHWRVCSKCGEDIDVGAHSFGEWVIISMPTDSEDGVRERSCVCGHSEDQRFYFEKNDATEKPNSYDPGEKDTARAQFGLGCFSAIGSASYLVLIPCLISAFALKRKKEE